MKTIFTIWTQPRQTFMYLEQNESSVIKSNINLLFYLGSLSMALPLIPQLLSKYMSEGQSPNASLIIGGLVLAMATAFFIALIFKHVHSLLIWIIGKALQGKASLFQIRLVMAYALIPGLISLLISCILIIAALVMNDVQIIGYQNPITLLLIWIFGLRSLIYGISIFNRFSYGYALLNFILSMSIIQGTAMLFKYLIH